MKAICGIPRRTFLRGLGTTIALPFLEAMLRPVRSLAAASAPAIWPPRRMAFLYVPNGANMTDWTPARTGTEFELPFILEPLKEHQGDLQVLSGLAHRKAFPNGDGAGDHARASATFLTGCQARKTSGADIRVGISVDQVAAAQIGRATPLPSLELSCDKGRAAGECDSGYSCAYQFHISWRGESTPNPVEVNPRLVFERLFSGGSGREQAESRAIREDYQKSILDFALEDANRLRAKLGRTDQRKLDEYLSSVRDIELRLEHRARLHAPDYPKPGGVPDDYETHVRLMLDLMVLAFQTDSTRIATFMLAHDGSDRPYPFIGVREGHHYLSHHEGKEEKKKKIAKINRFHITQFAYLLNKLKSTREGEGTLLDQCMIVYGSGIADGNSHAHDNLPVLLAGRGGGTLHPGRHVKYPKGEPMTNLYLAMLEGMGVHTDRLGDSIRPLADV